MTVGSPAISMLVEGRTDAAIARCILAHVGIAVGESYGQTGKPDLLRLLPRLNHAARYVPYIVLADLDHSADCAPTAVANWLPRPSEGMRLRVAVRAAEAWLLADAERLAGFLHVSGALIPHDPDSVDDPKAELVRLARRSSKPAILEDMVPRQGGGARIGPSYASRIIEFVEVADQPWRPEVAALHSDSLRRCIAALEALKSWHPGATAP